MSFRIRKKKRYKEPSHFVSYQSLKLLYRSEVIFNCYVKRIAHKQIKVKLKFQSNGYIGAAMIRGKLRKNSELKKAYAKVELSI